MRAHRGSSATDGSVGLRVSAGATLIIVADPDGATEIARVDADAAGATPIVALPFVDLAI